MTRRALTLLGLAAVIAALTGGTAQARTQYYLAAVPADKVAPGQSKGYPVYFDFDLVGRGCPLGPRCFKNATVRRFNSVDWAFPNCPEVEDQVFYLTQSVRAKRARPHHFHASGMADNSTYRIVIDGRFPRHGRIAKGWFTATDTASSCTSGKIYWTAERDTRVGP